MKHWCSGQYISAIFFPGFYGYRSNKAANTCVAFLPNVAIVAQIRGLYCGEKLNHLAENYSEIREWNESAVHPC